MDLIKRQTAIRKLKKMATQAYIDKLNGSAETVINCCIDVIERQIPSAQPEQRWIPVNEKLPEDEDVLIQFPTNMAVGRYCSEWRINSGGNWETEVCMDDEKPIAWKPLPEPFKKM